MIMIEVIVAGIVFLASIVGTFAIRQYNSDGSKTAY